MRTETPLVAFHEDLSRETYESLWSPSSGNPRASFEPEHTGHEARASDQEARAHCEAREGNDPAEETRDRQTGLGWTLPQRLRVLRAARACADEIPSGLLRDEAPRDECAAMCAATVTHDNSLLTVY